MKKVFAIFSVIVLFTTLGYSQSCGIISDEAGRITNTAAVTQGANALASQGADPHVITVANLATYGGTAEGVLNAYLHNCRTWATASGRRNANLIVIVIAPSRVESFYGAAYDGALGKGTAGRILASSAVLLFKSKQFGEGVGAAFREYAGSLAAYHDQSIHPVQKSTTIINQAADPKTAQANASVFKLLFLLLFLAALGSILFFILRKRSADRQDAKDAQQAAQSALQITTRLFRALSTDNADYLELSGEYQSLTNSVSYDPNTDGLSEAQYATIGRAWINLANDIRNATRAARPVVSRDDSEFTQGAPRAYAAAAGASPASSYAPVAHEAPAAPYAPATAATTPHPQPYQPQTTVIHHHTTTYVDNSSSSDGLLTGMIIGEAIASNNEREYERERFRDSYSAPTPFRDAPATSRYDDDDRSSGSVSFSSNDNDDSGSSGSVSFDDSSSSYDSGGGDSGGSDF